MGNIQLSGGGVMDKDRIDFLKRGLAVLHKTNRRIREQTEEHYKLLRSGCFDRSVRGERYRVDAYRAFPVYRDSPRRALLSKIARYTSALIAEGGGGPLDDTLCAGHQPQEGGCYPAWVVLEMGPGTNVEIRDKGGRKQVVISWGRPV